MLPTTYDSLEPAQALNHQFVPKGAELGTSPKGMEDSRSLKLSVSSFGSCLPTGALALDVCIRIRSRTNHRLSTPLELSVLSMIRCNYAIPKVI